MRTRGYVVDGKAVRDHNERLTRLFLESPAKAIDRATAMTNESARYNLEDSGTLSNPLIALGFLQTRYRDRFRFTLGSIDTKAGPAARLVSYEERARPTILRQRAANGDLPAHGHISRWKNGIRGVTMR